MAWIGTVGYLLAASILLTACGSIERASIDGGPAGTGPLTFGLEIDKEIAYAERETRLRIEIDPPKASKLPAAEAEYTSLDPNTLLTAWDTPSTRFYEVGPLLAPGLPPGTQVWSSWEVRFADRTETVTMQGAVGDDIAITGLWLLDADGDALSVYPNATTDSALDGVPIVRSGESFLLRVDIRNNSFRDVPGPVTVELRFKGPVSANFDRPEPLKLMASATETVLFENVVLDLNLGVSGETAVGVTAAVAHRREDHAPQNNALSSTLILRP
ncbi:hypothetical protein [Rhodospirillaceae bacterium SYSU D60014]|uniref:hypothetical protein n=1 Tax=Virgifigura deserti TaxID=2268457 RepID=UPI000E6626CF